MTYLYFNDSGDGDRGEALWWDFSSSTMIDIGLAALLRALYHIDYVCSWHKPFHQLVLELSFKEEYAKNNCSWDNLVSISVFPAIIG